MLLNTILNFVSDNELEIKLGILWGGLIAFLVNLSRLKTK